MVAIYLERLVDSAPHTSEAVWPVLTFGINWPAGTVAGGFPFASRIALAGLLEPGPGPGDSIH